MSGVRLTCDRKNGRWRVALWMGRELRDLYLCSIHKPDLTGAVVGAKVIRLAPGHKAAWLDAGLDDTIYLENPGNIRTGEVLRVRLTAPARQGKAFSGVLVPGATALGKSGILVDPPRPWQRAIAATKDGKIDSLSFAERDDRIECEKWLKQSAPQLLPALLPLAREAVHPELDDILDALSQKTVVLSGGGSIVIEETEALVAIDVNGGENYNALAVNLRAVKEIARQIRLRNLSGIIVIDALKMNQRTDQAKVMSALTKATEHDPAGVQVFGMTKLGLIEMIRRRKGR